MLSSTEELIEFVLYYSQAELHFYECWKQFPVRKDCSMPDAAKAILSSCGLSMLYMQKAGEVLMGISDKEIPGRTEIGTINIEEMTELKLSLRLGNVLLRIENEILKTSIDLSKLLAELYILNASNKVSDTGLLNMYAGNVMNRLGSIDTLKKELIKIIDPDIRSTN